MQEQDPLNPPQRELEAALKSLSPAPARVDAINAAFAAGHRSALRRARLVHSAVAAALLIAATAWLSTSPPDHPAATHPIAVATSSVPAPADQSMIILRRAVLQNGLDQLPEALIPAVRPLHVNDVL
jgi:hypothetical protein